MKQILLFFLLFTFAIANAQVPKAPQPRSRTNQAVSDQSLKTNKYFGFPSGDSAKFPVEIPDSIRDGAAYNDTLSHHWKRYNKATGQWVTVLDSTGVANMIVDSIGTRTLYFDSIKFKGLGTTGNPLTLRLDSLAAGINIFPLFVRSDGYLVRPNINFNETTNTIIYNGIKINANGGLQTNAPFASGTGYFLKQNASTGLTEKDTAHYLKAADLVNIYKSDGTIDSARTVDIADKSLTFRGTNTVGPNVLSTSLIMANDGTVNIGGGNLTRGYTSNTIYSSTGLLQTYVDNYAAATYDTLRMDANGVLFHYSSFGNIVGLAFGSSFSGISVADQLNHIGLVADASVDTANMTITPKSYVTSEWVTGKVAAVPSVNIYNSDGSLIGDRIFDFGAYELHMGSDPIGVIGLGSTYNFRGNTVTFDINNGAGSIGHLLINPSSQHFLKQVGSNQSGLWFGNAGLMVMDEINSTGLFYEDDYSANFTARSLVDKGYVDGSVAAAVSGAGYVPSVFGRTGAILATSGDYNTSQVTENTNLYFTNARVLTAPLTGYSSGAGTVSSSDNVLQAFQKINGNEVLDAANIATNTTAITTKLSASNFVTAEVPSGAINSSNTAFTLANTPTTGTVKIYRNGQRQITGTDYTISGTTITYLYAPSTGDSLITDYQK